MGRHLTFWTDALFNRGLFPRDLPAVEQYRLPRIPSLYPHQTIARLHHVCVVGVLAGWPGSFAVLRTGSYRQHSDPDVRGFPNAWLQHVWLLVRFILVVVMGVIPHVVVSLDPYLVRDAALPDYAFTRLKFGFTRIQPVARLHARRAYRAFYGSVYPIYYLYAYAAFPRLRTFRTCLTFRCYTTVRRYPPPPHYPPRRAAPLHRCCRSFYRFSCYVAAALPPFHAVHGTLWPLR